MKKAFLIIILIVSACSSAQTFRAGFDNFENSITCGYGQGRSFYSNVDGGLNNTESAYLEAYIKMFKATKDKKYLDKFVIHSK